MPNDGVRGVQPLELLGQLVVNTVRLQAQTSCDREALALPIHEGKESTWIGNKSIHGGGKEKDPTGQP
jgi:hypothetical protein